MKSNVDKLFTPIRFIPESPRWQLTRGQKKEAYKTLKRIANSNGKQMPETYETLLSDFPQDKTDSDGVQEKEDEKPIKVQYEKTWWVMKIWV
jgi:hypothetical protein